MCFTDKKLLRVQKPNRTFITIAKSFTDKKLLRVQKQEWDQIGWGTSFTDKKLLRVQKHLVEETSNLKFEISLIILLIKNITLRG